MSPVSVVRVRVRVRVRVSVYNRDELKRKCPPNHDIVGFIVLSNVLDIIIGYC